jgi:hypothetical protein
MAGFNPSTDMPMDWAFEETPPFQIPPVMSVKMADEIIKSASVLKELEENSAMSAALHTFGVEIDWQQVHDSYQEARIVVLSDQNTKLQEDLDTVTDAHNITAKHFGDAIEDRENLRADLQRMIDISTRQGQMINELLAAKGCDEPFIDDTPRVKVDAGDHYFSLQLTGGKPGDKMIVNQCYDMHYNGTYVLGDDRVFRKVSDDVNESM